MLFNAGRKSKAAETLEAGDLRHALECLSRQLFHDGDTRHTRMAWQEKRGVDFHTVCLIYLAASDRFVAR